ncbi:gamma-glutamyltranspeptidase [Microbacterium endophyticum]|uniref:Gamma-glutamyltranspeptidase n=1 Tax=Microbacterium endophyticum TaxID=1526412 RepID=A0A7W4V1W4_9MICO|nr:gamma-glutamyltransferase [Microbacterium endophyticum]MBB2975343.1 gamma-glutamyltranspeptidase [Microbacterium endophyticum]NIK35638.1 gamma-glutamyltranspeptidase [Microbacterium endophyticum]
MAIALAAPHRAAVSAGERAIASGGNALDAALAAAVMLTVVYPHQCAIGGDLIALVRNPNGETKAVLAAGTAPAAIDEVSSGWEIVPRQGAHSVTVPGMVAGWQQIAGMGARLELSSAFAGAADTAEEGFPVSAGLERAITSRAEAIAADVGLRGVFMAAGRALAEGDLVRQPQLAKTFRRLQHDPSDIYSGETALALVRALRKHGGTHQLSDFENYRVELADPVTATVDGRKWLAAPPPSVGALTLGVAAYAHGGGEELAPALVAASVRAVTTRRLHLGDPARSAVSNDALLHLDVTTSDRVHNEAPAHGDTAAVVAIDDEGWAVTIVQSVYQTFGAGLLDPETGIVLHNRGSAFTVDPELPSCIAPGARPPHTLAPLMIDSGDELIVAGCQGGRAQPWILAQLLSDRTATAGPLADLLERPRWVIGDVDLGFDTLTLASEPGVPETIIAEARRLHIAQHDFSGPSDSAGHVQLARHRRIRGDIEAASDPRADGHGAVFARLPHRGEPS